MKRFFPIVISGFMLLSIACSNTQNKSNPENNATGNLDYVDPYIGGMGHLLHATLSAKLNGDVLNRTWFTHEDLMNGATLELEMGAYPNKLWGSDSDAAPPSSIK
ncbi:hypothetical protein N9164_15410 [Draconibacterium sp.]|nr:hypothetical protein [Draconibacterium sp.]